MTSIREQEDNLFNRWEDYYRQEFPNYDLEKKELFCPDGLHFMGDLETIHITYKNIDKDTNETKIVPFFYYELTEDGPQEELYNHAFIRPLFLTKDYNQGGDGFGIDIRIESGLENDKESFSITKFHLRYLLLLAGLYKVNLYLKDNKPLKDLLLNQKELLEYCSNKHNRIDIFHKGFAVARMNLKKLAGGSKCDEEELRNAIRRDYKLIQEQISIYNPNIIVCCDGTGYEKGSNYYNPIMEMLEKMYPDITLYDNNGKIGPNQSKFIYYSKASNVIIIHEWHPSYCISYNDYFEAIPQLITLLMENIINLSPLKQ